MTHGIRSVLTTATAAVVLIGAGLIPAAAAPVFAGPSPAERQAGPAIVGHRGSGGTAPENTVAAFTEARRLGADTLETDIQLSADGIPFLFHDDTPARTTDVEAVFSDRAADPITSFTWDELRQLDAGSYFSDEFTGEQIPALNDVAVIAARSSMSVNVELKSPENSPGVEQVFADVLHNDPAWQRLVASGRVVVSSFDEASLRTFHALAPEVPLLQIGAIPDDATLASWAQFATGVVSNYRILDPADVERVHAAGLTLSLYTVNAPEQMAAVAELGVDEIITDFPGVLSRVLKGQKPIVRANGIEVVEVVANPAGDDIQPENGEYVLIQNVSSRAVDVSGYMLQDAVINRLVIGAGYVLAPGGDAAGLHGVRHQHGGPLLRWRYALGAEQRRRLDRRLHPRPRPR